MKLGIITAMSSERNLTAQLLENKHEYKGRLFSYTEGTIGGNTIILAQSGIGKVNSALGAMEMINEHHPDAIINTGVAGGIDTSLDVMDVVVGERTVYHDMWCGDGNDWGQVQDLPTYFEGDKNLRDIAMQVKADSKVVSGLICTGDQFISDADQLHKIKAKFPQGLAVDMESNSIAQTCYLLKTPFLSFRIISDIPGVENRYAQYQDFFGMMATRSFEVVKNFLSLIK